MELITIKGINSLFLCILLGRPPPDCNFLPEQLSPEYTTARATLSTPAFRPSISHSPPPIPAMSTPALSSTPHIYSDANFLGLRTPFPPVDKCPKKWYNEMWNRKLQSNSTQFHPIQSNRRSTCKESQFPKLRV